MPRANTKLAKSRLEALLSMASSSVAEPAAGLSGIYGLLTGGVDKGARNIERTRAALTYQPRDPQGQQELAQAAAPITSRLDALKNNMGDTALRKTGSPGMATAAYMVPDTLMTLLGARGAGVKGPKLSQMVERSAGPTQDSPAARLGIFAGKTADLNAMAARRALPESGSLVTPNTPTPEQMQRLSRIENVPLGDHVRSPQRELRWDKFDAGNSPGALVEGYGDMPVAVRLRNGEYLVYDGNHRTIEAMDGGASSMRMHVIDAADFDPEAAGRTPAPRATQAEDEALLAALGIAP